MDLKLDMTKLDKLGEDLKKLEAPKVVKGGNKAGQGAVPMFQSKGYLEKMGTKRASWFKRFFVLRDSFLLSYNLQRSDFTVEPNKCIHLVKCKIEMLSTSDRPFCFVITTADKDRFLFAAPSEKERNAWRKDIEIARIISHKNMVKLAVENQCIAEAKNLNDVITKHSASALALFSNPDYIKKTPVTGGAEGWLRTPGFCEAGSKSKKSLKKNYFQLKDSHILMYHSGDVLKKPRGCMYLVGTETKEMPDVDGNFRFICSSSHCADFIELVASSQGERERWMGALKIGSRVTYGDFKLLLKEHELLTNYTPGAAVDEPEPAASDEEAQIEMSVNLENEGLMGDELEPATAQPFDADGNPLVRNPNGKLVKADGTEISAKETRFAATGEQLDAFNRPLPVNAVPMFTEDGQPIGVGPDGQHYLPDGTVVAANDPHFDSDGKQLEQNVVDSANAVAEKVSVAIQVRARMKGAGAGVEQVDVLGRTFRPSKDSKAGGDTGVNADGDVVPMKTARRVVKDGKLVEQEEVAQEAQTGTLVIKMDHEGEYKELGAVEVAETSTLHDVRAQIANELDSKLSGFVFLFNSIPLTGAEELDKMALSCLPEIVIRGQELKIVKGGGKFSKKVESLKTLDEQVKREAEEFDDIMARVRAGNFLRKVGGE